MSLREQLIIVGLLALLSPFSLGALKSETPVPQTIEDYFRQRPAISSILFRTRSAIGLKEPQTLTNKNHAFKLYIGGWNSNAYYLREIPTTLIFSNDYRRPSGFTNLTFVGKTHNEYWQIWETNILHWKVTDTNTGEMNPLRNTVRGAHEVLSRVLNLGVRNLGVNRITVTNGRFIASEEGPSKSKRITLTDMRTGVKKVFENPDKRVAVEITYDGKRSTGISVQRILVGGYTNTVSRIRFGTNFHHGFFPASFEVLALKDGSESIVEQFEVLHVNFEGPEKLNEFKPDSFVDRSRAMFFTYSNNFLFREQSGRLYPVHSKTSTRRSSTLNSTEAKNVRLPLVSLMVVISGLVLYKILKTLNTQGRSPKTKN